MTNTNNTNKTVTSLPHRMEPFGEVGWTVTQFATAEDAAAFFLAHRDAAMPCWHRMEVVGGELAVVR
jgi:hypothetical protein